MNLKKKELHKGIKLPKKKRERKKGGKMKKRKEEKEEWRGKGRI